MERGKGVAGGTGCPASGWGVWRLLEVITTEAASFSGVMGSSGGCGRLPAPKADAQVPAPLRLSLKEDPTCPETAFPSPWMAPRHFVSLLLVSSSFK